MDRTTFRRVEISNTRTIRGRLYAQFWHRNSRNSETKLFLSKQNSSPENFTTVRSSATFKLRDYIYIYIYLLLGKRNNLITFVIP